MSTITASQIPAYKTFATNQCAHEQGVIVTNMNSIVKRPVSLIHRTIVVVFSIIIAFILMTSPAHAKEGISDIALNLPPELCDNVPTDPDTSYSVVCERGVLAPGQIKHLLANPYFMGASSPGAGQINITGINLDQLSSYKIGALGIIGMPHYYNPDGPLGHLNSSDVVVVVLPDIVMITDPNLSGKYAVNLAGYDSHGVKVVEYNNVDFMVSPRIDGVSSPEPETLLIEGQGFGLVDGVRVRTEDGDIMAFGNLDVEDTTGTSVLVSDEEESTVEVIQNSDGSITVMHPDLGGIVITALELTYQKTTVAALDYGGLRVGVVRRTEAPTVEITGPVSGAVLTSDPVVSFTVAGGDSEITCSVNEGVFEACASPFAPEGLVDGVHSVTVRAQNIAGGEQETVTFVLDLPAPAITITNQPDAVINETSTQVGFEVDNPAGGDLAVSCSVNGDMVEPCESPLNLTGLEEQDHSVMINAVGRGGSDSKTVMFTVAMVPVVSITSPENGMRFASADEASVAFDLTGGVTESVTCEVRAESVDGPLVQEDASCVSPYSLAGLAVSPDDYHVIVRASNASGTSMDSVQLNIGVLPDVVITSGPAEGSLLMANATSFTFDLEGVDSATCQLNDLPPFDCVGNVNTYDIMWGSHVSQLLRNGLGAGTHTFTVEVVNDAGSASASRSFAIPSVPLATSNSETGPAFSQFAKYDHLETNNISLIEVVEELADGSMIMTGSFTRWGGVNARGAVIAKVNSNLVLDESFGNKGLIRINTGVTNVLETVVHENGNIYTVEQVNGERRITRFDMDGNQDMSFGNIMLSAPASMSETHNIRLVHNVKEMGDSVYVMGAYGEFATNGNTRVGMIAKVNNDGSLDTTFGENGMSAMAPERVEECSGTILNVRYEVSDAMMMNDGKLVLMGEAWGSDYCSPNSRQVLYRINADGSIDTTFASGGHTPLRGEGRAAIGVPALLDLVDDGTKLVTVGGMRIGSYYARYDLDGAPDDTVNPSGAESHVRGILPHTEGVGLHTRHATKVAGGYVLIGNAHSHHADQWVMTRVDENGVVDTTFGTDGVVVADHVNHWLNQTRNQLLGMHVDAQGRIVGVGSVGASGMQGLVRRFDASGLEG